MMYDMMIWYDTIRYYTIWYNIWYNTIWYEICYDIRYDIFVNCNWVDTRWK